MELSKDTSNKFFMGLGLVFILMLFIGPSFATAPGGLAKAPTFITNIQTWLYAIAGVVVTLAFIWIGYQVIFNAAGFRDVARVAGGALMIGFAATMAALLIT